MAPERASDWNSSSDWTGVSKGMRVKAKCKRAFWDVLDDGLDPCCVAFNVTSVEGRVAAQGPCTLRSNGTGLDRA